MKSGKDERIKSFLNLPWENEYKITKIASGEGGGFSVSIPLLGSNLCVGVGDTIPEAIDNMRPALENLIEEYVDKDEDIPRPREEDDFSGTIIVRTTPTLHSRLVREAKNQNVSLNYLIGSLLERGLALSSAESVIEKHFHKMQELSWEAVSYHCHSIPRVGEPDLDWSREGQTWLGDEEGRFKKVA